MKFGKLKWETAVGLGGLALILVGSYVGLFVAQRERFRREEVAEPARLPTVDGVHLG